MRRLRQRGVTIIPEIVDSDMSAARPWFAMPWYANGSLERHVTDGTFRRDPAGGLRLLIGIARAVKELHEHGVAHRDLKPANILLNGGESIVLTDLGLCFNLEHTRITERAEAVGSRLYTAPENESGINELIEQRPADFYAFGKILWAVLAGRQPPARERQLTEPYTLQTQLTDRRFAKLLPLQERLLAMEPSARASDWREVLDTLEHFAKFLNSEGPTADSHFAAVSGNDGRIYVVGGQGLPSGELDTCEVYDATMERWERLTPMPTPRLHLGASVGKDGRIYAVGGERNGAVCGDNEAFDPATTSWFVCAAAPTPRSDAVVVSSSDGRIYFIGGLTPSRILDVVETFSVDAGTWAITAPLPVPLRGAAGTLGRDGRIYVIGGLLGPGGTQPSNSVFAYDSQGDRWYPVAPMPTARAWLCAVSFRERIYAVGGGNMSGALRTVEIYNPATDSWCTGTPLRTPRADFGLAVAGTGRMYAFGGSPDPGTMEIVSEQWGHR